MDATFQNLRLSTVTGEQNYIKANPLYFAVGVQVGFSSILWYLLAAPLWFAPTFSFPLPH